MSKRSKTSPQVIILQNQNGNMGKKTKPIFVHKSPYYARESWLVKYWRPAAAWTYLLICLFDFIIMPVYTQRTNLTITDIVNVTEKLRPEDKVSAMNVLMKKSEWAPLTLAGGGMFHIAFGAILGVAAWTRGRVLETSIQNGLYPMEEPGAPFMNGGGGYGPYGSNNYNNAYGNQYEPNAYQGYQGYQQQAQSQQPQTQQTQPQPQAPQQPQQPPQQPSSNVQSEPPEYDPKNKYNNPG